MINLTTFFINKVVIINFFFEVINERCEPLVLAFELFKAVCKLRQYRSLVTQEKIRVYMDLINYKQVKESKEFEASQIELLRSEKRVKKPDAPVISQGLNELRRKIQE